MIIEKYLSSIVTLMKSSKIGFVHRIGDYISYLWKYRNMLKNMVIKDLKGKYQNSILGYLWQLILPLCLIMVYFVVFNNVFGRNIPDYWLYLSSAVFALNMFSSSMSSGTTSITSNSGMVTKMRFPRELLIFENVIVNFINTVISYAILLIVMLLTNMPISTNTLFIPIILLLECLFASGVGLFLGSVNVYIRDVSYAVRIITMCLIFVTPCFYMLDAMDPMLQSIIAFNPVAYYTEAMHSILYFSTPLPFQSIMMCILIAAFSFAAGLIVFKKLEKGFAERL